MSYWKKPYVDKGRKPGIMQCYYNSRHNEMYEMHEGIIGRRRSKSTLTEKQLVTQHFNMVKRKLLSEFEIDQLYITSWTQKDPEEQLDVQPRPENGSSLLLPPLQSTIADMKYKIMDKLAVRNSQD